MNKNIAKRVNTIPLRTNPSMAVTWAIEHIKYSPGFKQLVENANNKHQPAKDRLAKLDKSTAIINNFLKTRNCPDSEASEESLLALNNIINNYLIENQDIITYNRK